MLINHDQTTKQDQFHSIKLMWSLKSKVWEEINMKIFYLSKFPTTSAFWSNLRLLKVELSFCLNMKVKGLYLTFHPYKEQSNPTFGVLDIT